MFHLQGPVCFISIYLLNHIQAQYISLAPAWFAKVDFCTVQLRMHSHKHKGNTDMSVKMLWPLSPSCILNMNNYHIGSNTRQVSVGWFLDFTLPFTFFTFTQMPLFAPAQLHKEKRMFTLLKKAGSQSVSVDFLKDTKKHSQT